MKKLLATTALSLMSFGAIAADLPVRTAAPAPVYAAPVFSWTGFYVGLNAGGAWTTGCRDYGLLINGVAAQGWTDNCRSSKTQFTGGAQAGYNFQAGSFVYGIEADINGVANSNDGTRTRTFANSTFVITGVGDPGVFGTIRARLGIAADRALFYVTGGLAWASGGNDPRVAWWNSVTPTGAPDVVFSRGGRNDIGWTLGAGIEYAFTNNWTAKIEYLYVDLGSEDNAWTCVDNRVRPGGVCGVVDLSGRKDAQFSVVRVGLNYKFGGSSGAVVARY